MAEILSRSQINKLLNQIDTENTGKNPTESTKSQEETINEIVTLLKNNKIDQVVVHGNSKITNEKGERKEALTLDPDLDARTALYLLNDCNKKNKPEDTYKEGAMTSFIPKTGSTENLTEKDGLRVFIDTGGNWLKIEKNEETITINIDHHGSGKKEPTSATKMMYEIMEKADLLKEKPEWLKKFVNLVNEIDNLTYLNKKDKWGKKTFDAKFFQNEWPYTLYALAENVPFETLLELCKSGKIKDLSAPLTKEQLNGEIGKIKTKDNFEITKECENQTKKANMTIESINTAIRDTKEKGLNLVTESLGKIVYHNFPKIELKNGKKITNKILNNLAFIGTKSLGGDTYISWNEQQGKFFINSHNPNLSKIVEELNKIDPGSTTDIRGEMVFGKIKNLTEEQFLGTIDPNILKDAEKIIEPQEEKLTIEDFKQIIKENEELIEKYKDEKEIIEAMIKTINYNERKNNDEKITDSEEKEWMKLIDDLEKKKTQIKDAKKTITEAKILLKTEEEKENSDKTQTIPTEKENKEEKTNQKDKEKTEKILEQLMLNADNRKKIQEKLNSLIEQRNILIKQQEQEDNKIGNLTPENPEKKEDSIENIEDVINGFELELENKKVEIENINTSLYKISEKINNTQKLVDENHNLHSEINKKISEKKVIKFWKLSEKKEKGKEIKELIQKEKESDNLTKENKKILKKLWEEKENLSINLTKKETEKIEIENQYEIEKFKNEISLDKKKQPFKYYLFEKITNKELSDKFKDKETGLFNLLKIENENSPYREFLSLQTTGKNEGYFEFTVSGFIMIIKNIEELKTEKGITDKSENAIYKILGPDGSIIKDNIKGYNEASVLYKEKSVEYEKRTKEEFNNLNNKQQT